MPITRTTIVSARYLLNNHPGPASHEDPASRDSPQTEEPQNAATHTADAPPQDRVAIAKPRKIGAGFKTHDSNTGNNSLIKYAKIKHLKVKSLKLKSDSIIFDDHSLLLPRMSRIRHLNPSEKLTIELRAMTRDSLRQIGEYIRQHGHRRKAVAFHIPKGYVPDMRLVGIGHNLRILRGGNLHHDTLLDPIWEAFKRLPKLTDFSFNANSSAFNRDDGTLIGLALTLRHLSKLRNLSIEIKNNKFSEEALNKLFYYTSHLKLESLTLNLSESANISNRTFNDLLICLKSLTSLQQLALIIDRDGRCPNNAYIIGDKNITELCSTFLHMPDLRKVFLNVNGNLCTEKSVKAIIKMGGDLAKLQTFEVNAERSLSMDTTHAQEMLRHGDGKIKFNFGEPLACANQDPEIFLYQAMADQNLQSFLRRERARGDELFRVE